MGLDRRNVLKAGIGGAALGLLGGGGLSFMPPLFAASDSSAAALKAADGRGVAVRREIATMKPDDDQLLMLREAVRVLRARSEKNPADPRGWDNLAVQHAQYCSSATPHSQVHWSWYFLVWHRAALWFTERHLRAAINEPTLALPYWDASVHRKIPTHFWGGPSNPLFDPVRLQGPDDVIPDDFLDLPAALDADHFGQFAGERWPNPENEFVEGTLEQSFHNNVHNWIGGNMSAFPTAAYDPLFGGHHGNIDRLWSSWLAQNPKRANPVDARWLNQSYGFFDVDGSPRSITTRQLLDTEKLGYRFDNLDYGQRIAPDPVFEPTGATEHRVLVDDATRAALLKGVPRARARLRFERVEMPLQPCCIRVFAEGAASGKVFAGTITVLPVQQPGVPALDRGVTMQLALPAPLLEPLRNGEALKVWIAPVPLKGRSIPETPLQLRGLKLSLEEA